MFDEIWFEELIALDKKYRHAATPQEKGGVEDEISEHFFPKYPNLAEFAKEFALYCKSTLPELSDEILIAIEQQDHDQIRTVSDHVRNLSSLLSPISREKWVMIVAQERQSKRYLPAGEESEMLFIPQVDGFSGAMAGILVTYVKTWPPTTSTLGEENLSSLFHGIGGEGAQAIIRLDIRPNRLAACFSHAHNVLAGPRKDYINQMMMWFADIVGSHYSLPEISIYTHIPWDMTVNKTTEEVFKVIPNRSEGRFELWPVYSKPLGLNDSFDGHSQHIESDDELRDLIRQFSSHGPKIDVDSVRIALSAPESPQRR